MLLRAMPHLQFYLAILSRNFIARQNRKCDMARRTTSQQSRNFIPIKAAIYSVQLCRENAVNADWSILVYTCDFVAR